MQDQANVTSVEPLADLLERHEETGNAELARQIGGEVWKRTDMLAIFSRPELGSGLNFACRFRSDEAAIGNLLEEVTGWFIRRGVAPHVRVSPLSRPATLERTLAARGFVQTEAETQMVHDGEDREPPTNPRVTLEMVKPQDLAYWVAIQHRGFGGSSETSELSMDVARASAKSGRNRLYLARLDGAAVGAGIVMDWAGVLGIYGVATAEDARGQGVGTAMVRQMIRDARAVGNAPLCLQAETASRTRDWYKRLGFRVVYERTGWTRENGPGRV